MSDSKYQIRNNKLEYIPLSEAGKILNTSRDYVNVLVRRKKLQAVKLGHGWFTTLQWIENYKKSVGKAKTEDSNIPLAEAANILRTSRDYVNVLVRRRKLRAVKLGRNWMTTRGWVAEYRGGLSVSEFKDLNTLGLSAAALAKAEKDEFRNLKSGLILEREKILEAKALIPEIKLTSRELAAEERKNILTAVQNRFKKIDFSEFEKASRHLGILKSLKRMSALRFAAASLAIVLLITAVSLSSLNISRFKDLTLFEVRFLGISKSDFTASIISDVFKNFPNDIPLFYKWFTLSLSKGLTFLELKTPSELALGELTGGESKIIKPQESRLAAPRVDTFDEALALDAGLVEELPQIAEGEEGGISGAAVPAGRFTLLENRLSVVEANLEEQKALTGAELSLQKKTILGALETLIGISKLLPAHPISTIVVQGQPATQVTYAVTPSVHSGFDRLSANYLTLSNNAEINGSLTVKSGGTFNTLSVSGATTLTGGVTIGGALSVAGDSTFGNITVNGTLSIPGSTSLGNASTTYLTVSNTGWINQLKVTGTATTTFNGPITSTSGNFIIAGDSASNVFLSPYGGNVGIGTTTPGSLLSVHSTGNVYFGGALTVSGQTSLVNASTSILTAPTFFSTNSTITNASTTYATLPTLWSTNGTITNASSTYLTVGNSVWFGASSADTLTVNSSINSNLIPDQNAVRDFGSSAFYWDDAFIDTLTANNISAASTTIGGTQSETFTINSDNVTVDRENSELIFFRGTVAPNALLTWNSATSSKRFELNQALYINNGSASTTNPTLTVQTIANQTANAFQIIDNNSSAYFTVNPVSQKTTMINASTTNLTVSGNLWAGSSGIFFLADGSTGSPSLAFANDTDTGLFRIGNDKFGLVTGATTSLTLDTGKVIVGNDISTASYQLEVADRDAFNNTIVDELRLSHFTTGTAGNGLGTGLLFYGQDSLGTGQNLARIAGQVEQATSSNGFLSRLIFSTVGGGGLLEKMRITGNGQLLLATTTIPSGYGMNVATSTNIYGDLTVSGQTSLVNASTSILTAPTFFSTNGTITSASSTNLTATNFWSTTGTITNASSTYLTVSDTAWINTLNLTSDLTVANGGTGASTLTGLLQGNGTSAITGVTGTTGQIPYYNGTDTLLATSTIFLSTANNIGIGTSTGLWAGTTIAGKGSTSATAALSVINSASTSLLFVRNDGNVGIGTTTPGSLLSVHSTGNTYLGGALTVGGQTSLVNASTSILTAPTFFSTNSTITNASTTYLTVGNSAWFGNATTSALSVTGGALINSLGLTNALTVANGGTGASTLTDHGVLVGSGTDAITALSVGTNGQLLIGSTGADPVFATLNCDNDLTCATGAGTLEIDLDETIALTGLTATNASTTYATLPTFWSSSANITGGTINGPLAVGGTWTAAATWTLPAFVLSGNITQSGNPSINIGTGALTAGAGSFTTGTFTPGGTSPIGIGTVSNYGMLSFNNTMSITTGLGMFGGAAGDASNLYLQVPTGGGVIGRVASSNVVTIDANGINGILGGTTPAAISGTTGLFSQAVTVASIADTIKAVGSTHAAITLTAGGTTNLDADTTMNLRVGGSTVFFTALNFSALGAATFYGTVNTDNKALSTGSGAISGGAGSFTTGDFSGQVNITNNNNANLVVAATSGENSASLQLSPSAASADSRNWALQTYIAAGDIALKVSNAKGGNAVTAGTIVQSWTATGSTLPGTLGVTGASTLPTIYGSSAANGDLTLEGTSHATKNTSYVILQPTGGNVGIGTVSPAQLLHLDKNEDVAVGSSYFWSARTPGILIRNPSATASSIAPIAFYMGSANNAVAGLGGIQESSTLGALGFFTGGSGIGGGTVPERMRITSAGLVGIGTVSPGSTLTVSSANAKPTTGYWHQNIHDTTAMAAGVGGGLLFTGNKTAAGAVGLFAGIAGYKTNATEGNESGQLRLYYSNAGTLTTGITLNESGNVGIGTTVPGAKLEVLGSGTTNTFGDAPQDAFVQGATAAITANTGNLFVSSNSAVAADAGGSIVLGGRWSGTAQAAFGVIKGGKTTGAADYGGYLAFGTRTNGASIAERMRIDNLGNVGIGTVGPDRLLTVQSATDAIVSVKSANTGTSYLLLGDTDADTVGQISYNHTSNFMAFQVSSGEKVRITSTGNVGIGTTSPASKLAVASSDLSFKALRLLSTDNNVSVAANTDILLGITNSVGASYTKISAVEDSTTDNYPALTFSTLNAATESPTERMRITPSGTVIIGADGTSAAGDKYLRASDSLAGFTNDPGANLNLQSGRGTGTGGAYMAFWTSTTGVSGTSLNALAERMRIDTSGNVGIGTVGPGYKLHVRGADATANLVVGNTTEDTRLEVLPYQDDRVVLRANDTSDTARILAFESGTSEKMRILTNGNVGIGTTGPGSKLQVSYANQTLTGNVADTTASGKHHIGAYTTDTQAADVGGSIGLGGYYNVATNYATFGAIAGRKTNGTDNNTAGYLSFLTNTQASGLTEKMRIDTSGNVGIGTTTPDAKLNVNGLIIGDNAVFSRYSVGNFFAGNAGGDANYGFVLRSAANTWALGYGTTIGTLGTPVLNWNSSGNVGIGDTSPAALLTVGNGDLFQVNSSGNVLGIGGGSNAPSFSFTGDPDTGMYNGGANIIRFSTGNSAAIDFRASNVISVSSFNSSAGGTSMCYSTFDVGTLGFNIGSCSSDERLKNSIAPQQDDMLKAISNLRPVTYKTNTDATSTFAGFIAQEVMQYIPLAVKTNPDGYYGLDTTAILSYAVGAIQQLNMRTQGIDSSGNVTAVSYTAGGSETVSEGDIVMATGGKNIEKATSTSQTIIGIVSTAPAMTIGPNSTSSYPIALAGRVPVKVSLENGPIAIGDRISVSLIPGVGKKASSTEATVGMALEAFDGWSPSTSSGQSEYSQIGKVLVFVNLGQPQLAAKQGSIDLATMNSDLNMDGFSLLNVKSITGMNGLWSIDSDGNIMAKSVNTQALTIGGGAASGVTVYDRETAAPKCIYIEGGVIKTSDGSCGTTQNAGSAAIISNDQIPISNEAPMTNDQNATTTPSVDTTTTTIATTTEAVLTATSTPATGSPTSAGSEVGLPLATTTEPILTATSTNP